MKLRCRFDEVSPISWECSECSGKVSGTPNPPSRTCRPENAARPIVIAIPKGEARPVARPSVLECSYRGRVVDKRRCNKCGEPRYEPVYVCTAPQNEKRACTYNKFEITLTPEFPTCIGCKWRPEPTDEE